MRGVYDRVNAILDRIDFEGIWNGFTRTDFALYDMENVYLKDGVIPYDNRFLGNTSIQYEGKNLAIWHVEDIERVNENRLAANMVHEMFHGFQYSQNETRFPDDIEALSYPRILENYGYKYNENILLVEAVNAHHRDMKLELLKKIIFSRKFRVEKFGDIIRYEFQVETTEGSAEYCGTKALKSISEEMYKERIQRYKEILLYDKKVLFDVRRCGYLTGTLFLVLLDQIGISFSKRIRDNKITIFHEIEESISNGEMTLEKPDLSSIEEKFQDEGDRVKRLFLEFFKRKVVEHRGEFSICGYDPMNMIKRKTQVFCSNFIMLKDNKTNEDIFIKGPLVIEVEDSSKNVLAYYTVR